MRRADGPQTVESILRNPAIWRADQVAQGSSRRLATGYAPLDQALPDAGWPLGALTELLLEETGIGELSMLGPALQAIGAEGRGIALIAPPYLPQARAWEAARIPLDRLLVVDVDGTDALWSAEQALRSGECGAVLLWGQAAGRALNHRALQRLHLAAGAGHAACFLYRSASAQTVPSPALLRIRLAAHAGTLHLHIVKYRGALRAEPVRVQPFPAQWDASPAPAEPPGSAIRPLPLPVPAYAPLA